MMFVWRMAARELRAAWMRLLFFFVCVAIGVGAIVALRSVIQSIRAGLTGQARSLIASDVLIQTNRQWTPQVRKQLDQRLAQAPVLDRTESLETATMVRPEQGAAVARMVELRGVQAKFPFYGAITLADGGSYSHDLLRNGGAIVQPELLAQLGVKPGDRIIIGGRPYTIRGVLGGEPGRRVGAFSFGSRVLVDYDDLVRSGLVTFGSRATYQILLRVREDGVRPLADALAREFRDRFITARSYRSTEDQVSEDLVRAENYLSLVGFAIVVLGGIGVWSVTRVFVRQKIKSVAVLKCLGATTAQVLATYVVQVVLLGLAGSAFGILLAFFGIRAIPHSIAAAFGGVPYGLTSSAALQGSAVGVLVSLLFSLVPLLEVRRIRPLLLLRDALPARVGIDWLQVAAAGIVSAALVAIAAWQAASLVVGLVVSAAFAGGALVLHLAGMALTRAVRPFAAARWFPLRHAVLNLRRPGNQTRVVLLAVGLGSFFVLGVRAVQSNLLAEFAIAIDRGGPDMFLIDIQPDQRAPLTAFLDQQGTSPHLIPVLRARVTGVRGRELNLDSVEDVRGRGSLAREYVITYRDHLQPNERVTGGRFWPESPLPSDAPELEVSVEQSLHERFRIGVGDLMRFDILGRIVEARVTSIRRVNWEDSRTGGFMFVFRPGPLDAAPQTLIATLRAPDTPADRARFQRDLVVRFPNVSAIDVREVLAGVQSVLDNVTLAISVVGAVALTSGVLILIGAVAMTKFQRVYEAAILRTLGASTRVLGAMLALEYTALGLLAGIIGAAGALALSWAACRYVFHIDWRPAPALLAAGSVLTAALVGTIGVLASADVLRKKPLATLRAE
jgi:putative ABC transport system permease protein